MDCPFALVLKIESCATGTYEPCQGRKAAALSKHSCVPQGSLIGVNNKGNAWKTISNTNARILYKNKERIFAPFLFSFKFNCYLYLKCLYYAFDVYIFVSLCQTLYHIYLTI